MSKFVAVNMVEPGAVRFDKDLGREVRDESSKPAVINADAIRAFYARKDGKPGSRITFNDGGGFAIIETPVQLAALVAGGEINPLALVPAVSTDTHDQMGARLDGQPEPAAEQPAEPDPVIPEPAPRRSRRAN
jgi:hypothetical protein